MASGKPRKTEDKANLPNVEWGLEVVAGVALYFAFMVENKPLQILLLLIGIGIAIYASVVLLLRFSRSVKQAYEIVRPRLVSVRSKLVTVAKRISVYLAVIFSLVALGLAAYGYGFSMVILILFVLLAAFFLGLSVARFGRVETPHTRLTYLGKESDRVGASPGEWQPNGKPDGCFRFEVGWPERVEVKEVILRQLNKGGNAEHCWSTQSVKNKPEWPLQLNEAVDAAGKTRRLIRAPFELPRGVKLILFIYAADNPDSPVLFKKGNRFLLALLFSDGRESQNVIKI